MTRDEAWTKFQEILAGVQQQEALKSYIPVAIVCLPTQPVADAPDELDVAIGERVSAIVVWSANFPVEERGRVLRNAAAGYVSPDATILRIKGTIES